MTASWRSEKKRRTRAEAQKFIDVLRSEMPLVEGVDWHLGGSWRRGAPAVGDLDVVLVLESGSMEEDLFSKGMELPKSFEAERKGAKIAQGDLVVGEDRMHLDVWVCTPKELGAFLMFISGPKELNIAQRSLAISKGYNLSQIGLLKDGVQMDDGTEENIYEMLGIPWLTPLQRQAFAAPKGDDAVIERTVEGSKGKTYTVRIQGSSVSCSCPGFKFRRAPRQDCKHTEAIRGELGK